MHLRIRTSSAVLSSLALTAAVFVAAPSASATTTAHHPRTHHRIDYVALGDSYTAAPFVPVTTLAGGCVRSSENYPHLAAARLQVRSLADVSCSGAQTKDMTQSQLPGVAPQLDALSRDTDLVTLSIGGNDENVFGTLVSFCPTLRASDPTGAPCRAAMRVDGQDKLLSAVRRTAVKIRTVIRQIQQRAPRAEVLVVGYPQIAPSHGTCPDLLPLADGDYRYAVEVNRALTDALRSAARRTGTTYVDVWRPSRGHDICAADPWINGAVTDPQRAAAFHPFANEQAAVAKLIEKAVDRRHSWPRRVWDRRH